MIAKASTTCTYSLDPITLSPGNSTKTFNYRNTSRACAQPSSQFLETRASRYIQSLPCVGPHPSPGGNTPPPGSVPRTVTLYFSRLLKNSRCTNRNWPHPPVKNQSQISPLRTPLAMTSSANHYRPPAPPHGLVVEVNGIEPMTSCLQSMRSPN